MARDDITQQPQQTRRQPQSFEPPAATPEKGGNMTVLARGTPQEVEPPHASGAGLDRSTVSDHAAQDPQGAGDGLGLIWVRSRRQL